MGTHLSRVLAICAIGLSHTAFAQSMTDADRADAAWRAKVNVEALSQPNPDQRYIIYLEQGGDRRTARARVDELAAVTRQSLRFDRTLATGGHLVTAPDATSRDASESLLRSLAAQKAVKYVEPDSMMRIQLVPNDTRYNEQWHYFEAQAGINVEDAWDIANGTGVRVAVIDTGITAHADLNANIVGGYDFISSATRARDGNGRDADPADRGDWTTAFNQCGWGRPPSGSSWHGTHVAGTVAARTNNGLGVAGVAFGARVVPVRALGRCGGALSDIAEAIIWASGGSVSGVPNNPNPARVINMSLGGEGACGSTYQNAITAAALRSTLVVVSAGNDNLNTIGFRPANCMNVMNVAALDRQGNRANYSNFGRNVDVSAPGGETGFAPNGVLSTLNTGGTTPGAAAYEFYQGTSMAAPHVAGIAALVLDVDPTMHASTLNSLIMNTTRPIPGACMGGCGRGLVDATRAVNAALPVTTPPSMPANFRIATYGGGINVLNWLPMGNTDDYEIYRSTSSSSGFSFHRRITSTSSTEYVSSNRYFKVRACNAYGCSRFTRSRLAYYRSCGGPGDPPCE